MRGQTDYGKGDADRISDIKRFKNSVLWHNIDKKKLKESTQEVLSVNKKEEK